MNRSEPTASELPPVAVLCAFYGRDSIALAAKAVRSILDQNYPRSKIHLYLYVDGPVGPLHEEFLTHHADCFFRIVRGEVNRGLTHALNALLHEVGDEVYLFRMDADDIALRERVLEQVRFMERNPTVDLLGCNSFEIGDDDNIILERNYPETHRQIVAHLPRCNPMLHPTYCLRAATWRRYPVFYRDLKLNEDLGFLFDAVDAGWRLHNLQERLFQWRTGSSFFARRGVRRAWVEMRTYMEGINMLYGHGLQLGWPVMRFGVRLLPNSVARMLYRSAMRRAVLRTSSPDTY